MNAHLTPLKEIMGSALFTANHGIQSATTVVPGGQIGMDRRFFDGNTKVKLVAAHRKHALKLVTSLDNPPWKFPKRKGIILLTLCVGGSDY